MVYSALDFKLLDSVVNQARVWGFICQVQELNSWLILPRQPNQRWKLQQVENRWILILGDVPQLCLYVQEAITFLEARWLENK